MQQVGRKRYSRSRLVYWSIAGQRGQDAFERVTGDEQHSTFVPGPGPLQPPEVRLHRRDELEPLLGECPIEVTSADVHTDYRVTAASKGPPCGLRWLAESRNGLHQAAQEVAVRGKVTCMQEVGTLEVHRSGG